MLDPFRSLEDAADPATIAWTAEQNARTREVLDGLPDREVLRAKFDLALSAGTIGAPHVRGGRAFFVQRPGERDQVRLMAGDPEADAAADRVLLDPSELDPTGLTTLDWWYPSPHGRYVAAGLSQGGDERSMLCVIDVASGARLADAIPETRYCSVAWLPDESGFYYTHFLDPAGFDQRCSRHTLGQSPAHDPLVFGSDEAREAMLHCELSRDGRRLAIVVHHGWTRAEVYLADRAQPGPERFVSIFAGRDALATVDFSGDTLYIRTNDGAPNYRLFAVEADDAADRERWREVVAESTDVLQAAVPVDGAVVLAYLHNVTGRLAYLRDGTVRDIALPLGSISEITGTEDGSDAYVATTSFFEPALVERLRFGEGGRPERTTWRRIANPSDGVAYDVRQEWFASRDGTRVPMFVLGRPDVPRDGHAPAVLYGYGGFSISLAPAFSGSLGPWLDAGGVYAIANLRGGGEFGEAWHRAGTRERKQNVFDDFAAAIAYLGSSGIADPDKIGILGGSNGGLLVAALATQAPASVRAVSCNVPLTDMLRYHRTLLGAHWVPEYGDPEVPADAEFLARYSPYHNVRDGVAYPAIFIHTAEADSRVDPMHARKFAARLLASGTPNPVLCTVEADAGHGAGKPRFKVLDELVDRWSFFGWQLGVRYGAHAGPLPVS